MLDADTFAAVDKLNNFYANRLPSSCCELDEENESLQNARFGWESGSLGGATY